SRPPTSTLLPYTTLFRSSAPTPGAATRGPRRLPSARPADLRADGAAGAVEAGLHAHDLLSGKHEHRVVVHVVHVVHEHVAVGSRSEEHTSELQSRSDLVC